MTIRFNRAVLLLAALAATTIYSSCKDNEDDDNQVVGGLRSARYMVTTNSFIDAYYTPKILNICSQGTTIMGDWYANEYIGKDEVETFIGSSHLDPDQKKDYHQEYAEHQYFINNKNAKKYCDFVCANNDYIFIDKNDIQSPYKEYSEYYGDTLCKCDHTDYGNFYGESACALPVIGIDVICDKDFDSNHPAGSLLNDITTVS